MTSDLDKPLAQKSYNKIIEVKKALGIDKNKEVSKLVIWELCKKQIVKEIFLLQYIVEQIKEMPAKIKESNKFIANAETDEDFIEIYNKIEALYKKDKVFKDYKEIINEKLELKITPNNYYFNMVIYGVCYSEINQETIFSDKNPIINLYIMQKWLNKQIIVNKSRLTSLEKAVISLFLDGYLPEEIINSNIIKNETENSIRNAMENTLPAKFKVDDIIQVLAIYIYNS